MNIPAQARRDIKLVASMLKGLVALDEALDEAGSAEKLLAATQAKVDALKAEEANMVDKLAGTQNSIDDARAKAVRLIDDATSAAAGIAAAADATKKAADDVLSDARAQSEALLATARQDAEDLKTSKNSEIASLEASLAQGHRVLDDVTAKVSAAEQRLGEVESQISALVRKFTGTV